MEQRVKLGLYCSQKEMKNNTKRNIWIVVLFVVLCIGGIAYMRKDLFSDGISKVCYGEECFMVELAITSAQQEQGLMYRTTLDEDKGMLFIFSVPDIYRFRMKNTHIPLDMLWIDEKGKIVRVKTAQPCTEDPCPIYDPEVAARYVLEINAWLAAKYGIQEWDMMRLRNINK